MIKCKGGKSFIHIKTVKGKGYLPAEKNPTLFHQPFTKFDIKTGNLTTTDDASIQNFFTYLQEIDNFLTDFAQEQKFFVVTPSTPPLFKFQNAFPDRYFDYGIAEQSCMTSATAVALTGKRVINVMFTTFLSRCYSQIFDLCLANANVINVVFYSGLTPFGPYQQANHIIGPISAFPNIQIMYAMNKQELISALSSMFNESGPKFIIVPKENPLIFGNKTKEYTDKSCHNRWIF